LVDVERVFCVHSGDEACRRAAEECPDVAVVDFRLPGTTGIDVIRRMRELCPTVRPVLISAQFTREALNAAIEADITALASKLASGDELIQVVQAAAEGTAYVSSDVVPLLAGGTPGATGTVALSDREREVLQALADGQDVPEIAGLLHLSQHTVRNHIRHAMQKLGVRRQLDAVVAATRLGYIEIAT
jgi:two-component system, NarL family, nitrate/nitrite response regulator NarL